MHWSLRSFLGLVLGCSVFPSFVVRMRWTTRQTMNDVSCGLIVISQCRVNGFWSMACDPVRIGIHIGFFGYRGMVCIERRVLSISQRQMWSIKSHKKEKKVGTPHKDIHSSQYRSKWRVEMLVCRMIERKRGSMRYSGHAIYIPLDRWPLNHDIVVKYSPT